MSGVSDIVRGQVDPREKASQSKIKAEFAGQRLDQRRRQVERCARDVARIQAEMMIELYPPDRLREQSGFDFINEVQDLDEGGREQAWQAVTQLLQNEKMRGFRLDVETDSTVELNAQAQQDSRVEFLQSAGSFLQNALPVMQASPEMVPVMGEMLLFAVRSFRSGRTLESKFEETVDALSTKVQQQQQAEQQAAEQGQEQQDPEAQAAQAEAQAKQVEMQAKQAESQAKQAEAQQRMQTDQAKAQLELAAMQQQMQIDGQKGALEIRLLEQRAAHDAMKPPPAPPAAQRVQ